MFKSQTLAFQLTTGPEPPGFIFWGLFVVFAAVVVGYLVWMIWAERSEEKAQARAALTVPELKGSGGSR